MKTSKKWVKYGISSLAIFLLLISGLSVFIKISLILGIFLYLLLSGRIERVENTMGLLNDYNNVEGYNKNIVSYKLEIYISPDWFNIYKKLSGNSLDKEDFIKKIELQEKQSDNFESGLYGRNYKFTEYYNSGTGLITKFQSVRLRNGNEIFFVVDDFRDSGYIFSCDDPLRNSTIDISSSDNLAIEIGEDFIRNEIFDKCIGGPRADFDYEEKNYLFKFPLYEIFNFLVVLGKKYHEAEKHVVIKWSDDIENKLQELGIKYEKRFDHEPKLVDIEGNDKEFFESCGKPQISLYSKDINLDSYFTTEEVSFFKINLTIFRPDENERFSYKP